MAEISMQAIVGNCGMSSRPEYYSGRGAITSDLNDRILEKIFLMIKEKIGETVAESFVDLVAAIPKLSATAFLQELYNWERNEYKVKVFGSDGVDLGPKGADGEYNEAIAFATIAGGLFGDSDRDETSAIRNWWLKQHGRTPKDDNSGGFRRDRFGAYSEKYYR